MALMARAYNQAHKFGVETTIPSEVVGFDTPDANKPGRFVLRLAKRRPGVGAFDPLGRRVDRSRKARHPR
jgi:hypothetical protein